MVGVNFAGGILAIRKECGMRQQLIKVVQWIRRQLAEKFSYYSVDFPYYLTIAILAFFCVVALNAFVELTEELAENELHYFDRRATDLILSLRSDQTTAVFTFITNLGGRGAYMVIAVLLILIFSLRHWSRKAIIQISIVMGLAAFSNIIVKEIIGRERPLIDHLVSVSSLSYPSGHAMSAMAFYGFLVYLITKLKISTWLKVTLSMVCCLLILVIGISRIYLGVHFPSDVLAGFIGGFIWVMLCAVVFNMIDLLQRRKLRKASPKDFA